MDALQPFAYPIALVLIVILLALIFWRPIAGLIGRVQRAKMGENAVEFGDHRQVERHPQWLLRLTWSLQRHLPM
jgi:hypothetical protein